ncbi:metallophosphoesterase family protein [Acinetobacter lwoffii]|uniref:metallophosphoesterase family protein n=1 Tax=Acinetobacter TaxID=469 RepID=UPI0015D16521|nr:MULTISPECIES: metallophosphoesterase [Acinetobacter]QXB86683.1 metallophosphoesterase family protein [Acinetobacter lwoffii]
MKFIIINDIHSNSVALSAFTKSISFLSFDKIIFLGDALTYGVNVAETITLLKDLEKNYDCEFIKGNHEQIYFDFQNNKNFEYKKFPEFLLESIYQTGNNLSSIFENEFNWKESYLYGDIIFTHANLLGYGNWSYLNTEGDFSVNYEVLKLNNLKGAILGHTHRAKHCIYSKNQSVSNICDSSFNKPIYINQDEKFLVTNGSLGQPRGSCSSYLICTIESNSICLENIPLIYDVILHCKSILGSNLSLQTKNKLLNFYR